MVNEDTIKLLKECDAGTKTAVNSFYEVMEYVSDENLKKILQESHDKHEKYGNEIHELLNKYQDSEKDPSAMSKTMSWLKINFKLMQRPKDSMVADLIVDGCNMGVKSLYKYLNQYPEANDEVKSIAKEIIKNEEELADELKNYL